MLQERVSEPEVPDLFVEVCSKLLQMSSGYEKISRQERYGTVHLMIH